MKLKTALTMATMASLLAACQQEPVQVVYKQPGTMLKEFPAPSGQSANLSYFPRWNGGAIEVAQGDKSGPVSIATAGRSAGIAPVSNATVPVDYASRDGGSGAAGSEAARFYTAQQLPAARIGAAPVAAPVARQYAAVAPAPAQHITAQNITAQTAPAGAGAHSHAPIPLQASPFGKVSVPLAEAAPTEMASVAPVAQPAAFAAVAPAPAPAPAQVTAFGTGSIYAPSGPDRQPRPTVVQDGSAHSQFAAVLAGERISPTPVAATDYTGSIPLGGGVVAPEGGMHSAAPSLAAPAPQQVAAAVPAASTVQQATAAPVATGTIQSRNLAAGSAAAQESFVIHANSSHAVLDEDDFEDSAQLAANGKASPVQPVAATSLAASEGLEWPLRGAILSRFGSKPGGKSNDGVNIGAKAGAPIRAAADGMVVYAGNELQGYGNMLVVSHDGGRATVYAHAQKLDVQKGQFVKQGQVVGTVGQSGGVSQPQLHFAVREGSTPVDPMPLLQKNRRLASVE